MRILPSLSLLFVLALGALFATGVLRNGAPASVATFGLRCQQAAFRPVWKLAPPAVINGERALVNAEQALEERSSSETGDPQTDDETDGELTPLSRPPAVVPAAAARVAASGPPLLLARPGHAHRREHPPKA